MQMQRRVAIRQRVVLRHCMHIMITAESVAPIADGIRDAADGERHFPPAGDAVERRLRIFIEAFDFGKDLACSSTSRGLLARCRARKSIPLHFRSIPSGLPGMREEKTRSRDTPSSAFHLDSAAFGHVFTEVRSE